MGGTPSPILRYVNQGEKFDSMLKEVDEEYRTILINFGKYKLVMFAMAKLIEMDITEQNRIAMYLLDNTKITK